LLASARIICCDFSIVYMFPRKISSSVIEACLPVKVIERGLYKDNFTITKRMQLCVLALDWKEIANYRV
jgi:hypothetical protein